VQTYANKHKIAKRGKKNIADWEKFIKEVKAAMDCSATEEEE